MRSKNTSGMSGVGLLGILAGILVAISAVAWWVKEKANVGETKTLSVPAVPEPTSLVLPSGVSEAVGKCTIEKTEGCRKE